MNTFTEDLRQIAGRLIDLHSDCRRRHHNSASLYCFTCYQLLGQAEALMAHAGVVEEAEQLLADPPKPKSAGHIMNSKF